MKNLFLYNRIVGCMPNSKGLPEMKSKFVEWDNRFSFTFLISLINHAQLSQRVTKAHVRTNDTQNIKTFGLAKLATIQNIKRTQNCVQLPIYMLSVITHKKQENRYYSDKIITLVTDSRTQHKAAQTKSSTGC